MTSGPDPDAVSQPGGFVDLHCHGGAGHSFDDADAEGIRSAIAFHRSHGAARIVLSLVSAPMPRLLSRIAELTDIASSLEGCEGLHLEGPFLAPDRRGAHDLSALSLPTEASVSAILEAAHPILRVVTIAPELPGALAAIRRFVDAGVTVAVGHTEATYDQAAAAFDLGAGLVTHTYNAMRPMLHRAPGPVGAALDRDHVILEAIADGHHLHDAILRSLFAAAPDRVALVTDAMSAAGQPDGAYRVGEMEVEVRGGVPYLAGTTVLAGSTLTMDAAVAHVVSAGISPEAAANAAGRTPLRALGRAG